MDASDKNGTTEQKRIAAIHDLSGMGRCSLTVALPIISSAGVECSCIPTALLSTHTGEFEGYTFLDLSDQILPIARHWRAQGEAFDGIYSGYLTSPQQVKLLLQTVNELRGPGTLWISDPVMADNGEFYSNFNEEMVKAHLESARSASIITPNITEASLLTSIPYRRENHSEGYISDLLHALAEIGPRICVLTGVSPDPEQIGCAALDASTSEIFYSMRRRVNGVFYGTGDIFASSLSALLIRGAPLKTAIAFSVALVSDSIERTIKSGRPRRYGVNFEGALRDYSNRVAEIFEDKNCSGT